MLPKLKAAETDSFGILNVNDCQIEIVYSLKNALITKSRFYLIQYSCTSLNIHVLGGATQHSCSWRRIPHAKYVKHAIWKLLEDTKEEEKKFVMMVLINF